MSKIIIISILSVSFLNTIAQKKFNVACRDFTVEKKKSVDGEGLKQLFEIALSKADFPFKIVEREKMDKLFSALQEEKNLHKDFANEFSVKLQLASVDYLVDGNLERVIGDGQYKLIVEFIKITGDEITTRLPLMIIFSKDLLNQSEELKKVFEKSISSFVSSYFIDKKLLLSEKKDIDILTELEKRDEKIRNLDSILSIVKTDADVKNSTINNLSKSINSLQKNGDEKDEVIKKLTQEISIVKDSIKIKEQKEFNIRHTPPEIYVQPFLDSSGRILVFVQLLNEVPIELKVNIYRGDRKSMRKNFITLSNPKIYPSSPFSVYQMDNINNGQFPADSSFEIIVYIDYWSIYLEEMQLPNLKRNYSKYFIINRKNYSIDAKQ